MFDVAEDLQRHPRDPLDWGAALLHAYLGVATGEAAFRMRALATVAEALQAMETTPQGAGVFDGGVAGVAWLAAHVYRLLGERVDGESFEDVDAALVEYVSSIRRPAPYDVISGLLGVGLYFLERLPGDMGRIGAKRVCDLLAATAEPTEDGVTWWTDPSWLPDWQRARAPRGYYDLGVAHGVPGIVGFLATARRCAPDLVDRNLLAASARWVLSHVRPDGSLLSWVPDGIELIRGKIAWCYGGLGVSVVLLSAGLELGDPQLVANACRIARCAAEHRIDAGVRDACLCHGAAGNGHLYNRLFHVTGDALFRETAEYWFDDTLRRRSASGIGGFRRWISEAGNAMDVGEWRSDPSFLSGASGTALALLSAITDLEPNWDRLLLADIPARPRPSA